MEFENVSVQDTWRAMEKLGMTSINYQGFILYYIPDFYKIIAKFSETPRRRQDVNQNVKYNQEDNNKIKR